MYLEEDHVVHNLRVRYERDRIYTKISTVLIAINPYDAVPLYGSIHFFIDASITIINIEPIKWNAGESEMDKYRAKKRAELAQLPPHCYSIGEEAFQNLAKFNINQVWYLPLSPPRPPPR